MKPCPYCGSPMEDELWPAHDCPQRMGAIKVFSDTLQEMRNNNEPHSVARFEQIYQKLLKEWFETNDV